MKTFSPLLFLGVILVAACSTAGGASPPGSSSPPVALDLDGRTFLSTSVAGHTLVPDTMVRLQFEDGRLGAGAGCNQMSGAYTIADGRLSLGQMAMTAMGCEQSLMDQDTWLESFLGGATVRVEGDTLTLANGEVTMTLKDREVADPDRPLEGTDWVLDGIISADAVSSVPVGVEAGFRIADGQLELNAGCNGGGGPVTVTPTTLTIGPLMLTKKACEADPAAVESAVTTVLSGEVEYTIEADRLTLRNGTDGLTFRAAS